MSTQKNEIIARASHVLVTPRKANLVLKSIVGLQAGFAIKQLTLITKRAADPVSKLIKQAIGNAVQKSGSSPDKLTISEAYATKGRTLKRALIGGRSRTKPFRRIASHMTIKLKSTQINTPMVAKTVSPDLKSEPVKTINKSSSTTKVKKVAKSATK